MKRNRFRKGKKGLVVFGNNHPLVIIVDTIRMHQTMVVFIIANNARRNKTIIFLHFEQTFYAVAYSTSFHLTIVSVLVKNQSETGR